jgi:hypothetical protein
MTTAQEVGAESEMQGRRARRRDLNLFPAPWAWAHFGTALPYILGNESRARLPRKIVAMALELGNEDPP